MLAPAARRGRALPRAVPPRVAARGVARSPERDPDLRRGRVGRPTCSSRCATSRAPTCRTLLARGRRARARPCDRHRGGRSPRRSTLRTSTGWCTATSSRATSLVAAGARRRRARLPGRLRADQARHDELGLTDTGQFVGTIDYVAPEQHPGPAGRTRAADLYSLGCVLFECLTGRGPVRAETDAAAIYAHLEEPPRAVTADRPELPQEIDGVIGRAMAKAPDDRPESAGARRRTTFQVNVNNKRPGGDAPPTPPGVHDRAQAAVCVTRSAASRRSPNRNRMDGRERVDLRARIRNDWATSACTSGG